MDRIQRYCLNKSAKNAGSNSSVSKIPNIEALRDTKCGRSPDVQEFVNNTASSRSGFLSSVATAESDRHPLEVLAVVRNFGQTPEG